MCDLATEIQSVIRRATNEANRTAHYREAGEDNPYKALAKELAESAKVIDAARSHVEYLNTHLHVFNDDDYCIHCGLDGRS